MPFRDYCRVVPTVKFWSRNDPVQKTETDVCIRVLIKAIDCIENKVGCNNLWTNSQK